MRTPCLALWPSYNPRPHWTHVAQELMKLHGMVPPTARPLLLALRGVELHSVETHQPVHRASYDDSFVLLAPDAEPYVFAGSSHAYQMNSAASPDTDGDGKGDVGSIRCGRYVMHFLPGYANGPIFHIKMPDGSDRLPAHRDFDHDGVVSAEEARRSEVVRKGAQTDASGCWANSVLFHIGYTGGKSSIACFTASARNLEALKAAGTAIDLILANAWDVLPYAEDAQKLYGMPEPAPPSAPATPDAIADFHERAELARREGMREMSGLEEPVDDETTVVLDDPRNA